MTVILPWIAGVVGIASVVYLLLALWKVLRHGEAASDPPASCPPVSVLKPLCGAEPGLYDMLRSFCLQDYPHYEVIFGVRHAEDPAIAVVRRLQAEHPDRRLHLVVDDTLYGPNRKVSNLVNMAEVARHEIIVISDSDVRAAPNCLSVVIARMEATGAAAVSCLYKGWARPGLASRLGALYINDWFLSSAIVEAGTRSVTYCFGPFTAVRRRALEQIGGLRSFAHDLADDYQLGNRLASNGHRVALSTHAVDTLVAETPTSLVAHELRWARTVRALRPLDHCLSVVTCINPLLAVLVAAAPTVSGISLLAASLGLRAAIHLSIRKRVGIDGPSSVWLLPLRETLCLGIWVASYCGRRIKWRGQTFVVGPQARLIEVARPAYSGPMAPARQASM